MVSRGVRTERTDGSNEPSEQDWAPLLAPLPAVAAAELVPPGGRLLVVAPHPDDEVLGSGGLIHAVAEQGRDVRVLCVTDGEASHPGSQKWLPDRLGPARFTETVRALARLGVEPEQVVRMGLDDGELPRQQAELSRAVVRNLQADDVVVTPWRHDGHPDHEIVAAAVLDALQVLPLTHLEAPISALYWADPGQDVLPLHRAVRLPLDERGRERKREAVRCFTSQLEPDETTGRGAVLPEWVLRRLESPDEVYFR